MEEIKVCLKKCKKCNWYYFDNMTKDDYCEHYKDNIQNLYLCLIMKKLKID